MQYYTDAETLYRVCGCSIARWSTSAGCWLTSGDLDRWWGDHEGWLPEIERSDVAALFPTADA